MCLSHGTPAWITTVEYKHLWNHQQVAWRLCYPPHAGIWATRGFLKIRSTCLVVWSQLTSATPFSQSETLLQRRGVDILSLVEPVPPHPKKHISVSYKNSFINWKEGRKWIPWNGWGGHTGPLTTRPRHGNSFYRSIAFWYGHSPLSSTWTILLLPQGNQSPWPCWFTKWSISTMQCFMSPIFNHKEVL